MIRAKRPLHDIIDNALLEDGAWSDWTSLGLPDPNKKVRAVFWARQEMVVAGMIAITETFSRLAEDSVVWKPNKKDGERAHAGEAIGTIEAEAWVVLGGERTALNFMQRLSGVATLTRKYVDKVAGLKAMICDTRKTTPGIRALEKYAVKCGGGINHRFGLNDGCLVKDNHIRIAGGIKCAVSTIRRQIPHLWCIEVEVETLAQLKECMDIGVEAVLLDNMSIHEMTEAVKMINGSMLVEASGGIGLHNIEDVAKTGVDLISIGALTHSVQSVDISLELEDSGR